MLAVVSGLAPRWGAKRPRLQALWWVRQKRFPGCRAASQPSAAQACSLQQPGWLEGDGFAAGERVRQGAAVHQFQLASQRHAVGDA